jgi:N-acetyl-anhydromuramyl-L-alanine amidase AmpD
MARGVSAYMRVRICVATVATPLLMMVVGCQTGAASSSALPGPNFAGPVIDQPAYIPPPQIARIEPTKPEISVTNKDVPAAWVPRANAEKRAWKWIVIHHSATAEGGAVRFDKGHKAKGWDELGYHFVIGNGSDTADGLVEVGSRWPVQKHGAHAKTPDNRYNDYGIGICLVGNFDVTRPTSKQMASLTKLVAYLADKYRVPQANIIGHSMTGKSTDCPGKFMDIAAIRNGVARQRASLAEELKHDTSEELMRTASR